MQSIFKPILLPYSSDLWEPKVSFIKQRQIFKLADKATFACICQFEPKHYYRELYKILNITLPETISKGALKRQADFLAGRYVAKLALEQLGFRQFDIKIGFQKAPVFPDGITGSISHNDALAVCIVSKSAECNLLGIDVENIISNETCKTIERQVLNQSELIGLSRTPYPVNFMITLVFSAKETLFKAIYPYVKQYLDFNTSEVVSINHHHISLKLRLPEKLQNNVFSQKIINCHYFYYQGTIITLLINSLELL